MMIEISSSVLAGAAGLTHRRTPETTTSQSGPENPIELLFGGRTLASSEVPTTSSATGSTVSPFYNTAPSIASATSNVTEAATSASTAAATATAATTTDATTTAATDSTTSTTSSAATTATPGIEALVAAIMSGSVSGSLQTDPSKLQETGPAGTDTMPNFYYASDQTADQMAQLLGGTVVQMKAFGQDAGWTEPNANFIQLPNGQTFNAADLAYYVRNGAHGVQQLTAAITQTVNQGSAWTDYYQNGGPPPTFPTGYIGPPISGMTYPAGTIGADGNVINPYMPATTQGT